MMDVYKSIIIDPDWITSQVKSLEKRIASIHEREMRHAIIVEFISGFDELELVCVLHEINLRSANGLKRPGKFFKSLPLNLMR